jgi:hypothetical protein
MPRFRKRPVEVEAYQVHEDLYIETLEGRMHASPGDWIVVGVHGERYPVKPDIFEKTYEPVRGDGSAGVKDTSCRGSTAG